MIAIDTNILAYFLLRHPKADAAKALYRRDPDWASPPLWRSEFRNVLAGYLRAGKIERMEAETVVVKAAGLLAGRVQEVPDSIVFGLVSRSSCTAYDCEFAGLAAVLGTKLVTEDHELLREFPQLCLSLKEALESDLGR